MFEDLILKPICRPGPLCRLCKMACKEEYNLIYCIHFVQNSKVHEDNPDVIELCKLTDKKLGRTGKEGFKENRKQFEDYCKGKDKA